MNQVATLSMFSSAKLGSLALDSLSNSSTRSTEGGSCISKPSFSQSSHYITHTFKAYIDEWTKHLGQILTMLRGPRPSFL
jgi:hypothetical protein